MNTGKRTRNIVLAAVMFALALACLGCSQGSGYDLSLDKTDTTQWGTVFKYKVNPNWEDGDYAYNEEYGMRTSYKSDGLSLAVNAQNTKSSRYEYDSRKTYDDWCAYEENFYTRSAKDQAQWYIDNVDKTNNYYDESQTNPDIYPDYSNYSLVEKGWVAVGDNEFRVYELKYTMTYSDSKFAEMKEKNPDAQQVRDEVVYHALLKDGEHDVDISAMNGQNSEKLMLAFLGTLDITW